ncbi:hypothetical protein ALON55S_03441 [Alishewanella longhuensis]
MHKYDIKTFQGLILALQDYWARQGCVIVQPLDLEVGAGTFHPMTFLRSFRARANQCGLCAALSASYRWSLWRKP